MNKHHKKNNIICYEQIQKEILMLVNEHKEYLYWHIRKIVISHEDTDKVLHTCIKIAYDNARAINNKLDLLKIATEKSIDFLKEKKENDFPNKNISIETILSNTLENDNLFQASDEETKLYAASLLLSENQRLIFNMKYFDNMDYSDIAQILEQSKESCQRIFLSALSKVEAILKLY